MQQHSMPQGWQGTWPPPAGVALPPNFPGPPSMPPGANTHPHWKAGFWQYKPTSNMNGAGPGVYWATGMRWARNVPANFNPYKRVPRPASPSYWRTQLSENGLGFGERTWSLQGVCVIWPPNYVRKMEGVSNLTYACLNSVQ
ncbi:uncharacterized protein HD556DRAFT_1492577 [Suillus plorans]|uniref:Uncharacterized protein n=1 Tax=Suillus plorans TaxID=116603 RepID=A0A9P7AJM3_9AGAM|nr:uncharacterized protein HD556DRAFT_1492577 [Suillus plorans]KAG1789765.1 hypothetical protein HD556DRAFT_1492577 [Suillus plorans]